MEKTLHYSFRGSWLQSTRRVRRVLTPVAARQTVAHQTRPHLEARRHASTDTTARGSLSPGESLAANLQRIAIGLGLALAGAAVYYRFYGPTVRLESAERGGKDKHKVATDNVLPGSLEHGTPRYASHEELQQAIKELQEALHGPEATNLDPKVLKTYGFSENSYHPASPHSVIVRPENTDDVVSIVNIARKYRVPIVPYSGATSLEGHTSGVSTFIPQVQVHERITSSTTVPFWQHLPGYVRNEQDTGNPWLASSLRKLPSCQLIVSMPIEADSDLICQSGVRWEDINSTLKEKGIPLFFPVSHSVLHKSCFALLTSPTHS